MSKRKLNRRNFLKAGGGLAGLLSIGGFLASCKEESEIQEADIEVSHVGDFEVKIRDKGKKFEYYCSKSGREEFTVNIQAVGAGSDFSRSEISIDIESHGFYEDWQIDGITIRKGGIFSSFIRLTSGHNTGYNDCKLDYSGSDFKTMPLGPEFKYWFRDAEDILARVRSRFIKYIPFEKILDKIED